MSAPEPTAVEVIAEVLGVYIDARAIDASTAEVEWMSRRVVAAIRAMSPQQQAELIGGMTTEPTEPDEDGYRRTRVIGPWRLQP